MASIKEAFDSTMKEAFAGIKIMIWGIPLAYGLASIIFGGTSGRVIGYIVTFITSFLYYGLCVTAAHNVISRKDTIMPGFNIIEIFVNGALAFVSTLPYIVIAGLLSWGVQALFVTLAAQIMPSEFFAEHPQFTVVFALTILQMISFFIAAIPITALVIFVRRMNVFEVFNIKKYFFALGETFLSYTTFTIRFALLAVLVFGFIFYLFYLFIGFHNAFWVYLLVLMYLTYQLLLYNAIAQISEDIFTFPEKEEQKRNEDAMIKKMIENHQ